MKIFILFVLGTALTVSSVFATDQIQMGEPSYEGDGCPQGTLAVSVDRARNGLQFQFEPLVLEAGRLNHKTADTKDCSVILPVRVPKGLSISLAPVEYSGIITLPLGGTTQLTVNNFYEYLNGGTARQTFWYKWSGEQNRTYSAFVPNKPNNSPFWSACGVDMNLRMSFSFLIQTPNLNLPAYLTLEQLNGYQILTKQCSSG